MRLFLFLFLVVVCTEAKEVAVYNQAGGDILQSFTTVATGWSPTFYKSALFMLGALTVFETIYIFGNMALDGKLEPASIMGQLVKIAFIYGFFYTLIFGIDLNDFVRGISSMADKASGKTVTVDTMIDQAGDIWAAAGKVMGNLSGWSASSIPKAITIIVVAALSMLAVLGIGLTYLIAQIKAVIFVATSPIWISFGVFHYTRQWAINAITAFIKLGVELLFLKLIVALAVDGLAGDMEATMQKDGSMILLIIKAAAFFSIAKMVSSFVDSIFSGSTMGNANGAGQALKSTAFAAAGALGAIGAAGMGAKTAVQASNATSSNENGAGIKTKIAAGLGGAVSGATKSTARSFGIGSGAKGAGENTGAMTTKVAEMGQKWASSLGKDKEKTKSNTE